MKKEFDNILKSKYISVVFQMTIIIVPLFAYGGWAHTNQNSTKFSQIFSPQTPSFYQQHHMIYISNSFRQRLHSIWLFTIDDRSIIPYICCCICIWNTIIPSAYSHWQLPSKRISLTNFGYISGIYTHNISIKTKTGNMNSSTAKNASDISEWKHSENHVIQQLKTWTIS